jgi:hypothetical protein
MLALLSHLALGSQSPIGKYSPNTNVMDHANIDLDQKALEAAFGSSPYNFAAVKAAWMGAGNSKATATCTLAAGAAVPVTAYANSTYGDKISYKGTDGVTYSVNAATDTASGGTTVTFKPMVVQHAPDGKVDTTTAISITGGSTIGTCATVTYSSGRHLSGFSTSAKAKMLTPGASCPAPKTSVTYRNGCPYTSYEPYYNYYCSASTSACNANGDYVNQMVIAAADATSLTLENYGTIDFSSGAANQETFRKDFLKKFPSLRVRGCTRSASSRTPLTTARSRT